MRIILFCKQLLNMPQVHVAEESIDGAWISSQNNVMVTDTGDVLYFETQDQTP